MAKRKMTKREAGRLGGLATLAKHGVSHMAKIGRRGRVVTCKKYFNGDYEAMDKWLSEKGLWSVDKDVTYGSVFKNPGDHPANEITEEISF